MSAFVINGEVRTLPVPEDASLQELVGFVRKNWSSENSLITAIVVNGTELSSEGERELNDIPLNLLDTIEVFTAHPREIAEETLQMLKTFTDGLVSLCEVCAQGVGRAEAEPKFLKLVEGMGTFHEALTTVKKILRLEEDTRFGDLYQHEGKLIAILKEVLAAKQTQNQEHLRRLLGDLLPNHLRQWRDAVIPAIIRGRDS